MKARTENRGSIWIVTITRPEMRNCVDRETADGLAAAFRSFDEDDSLAAAEDAVFGVYCRRWGVPLVDEGTIRLPRLIGQSHAMDLILTGRGVSGEEARSMGLVNRMVEKGRAFGAALEIAESLARFPQRCMRSDRLSALTQLDVDR